MPFSSGERALLLQTKGVGPKVVERLEQLGVDHVSAQVRQSAPAVCNAVAGVIGGSRWKNSPQARKVIETVIALAAKFR